MSWQAMDQEPGQAQDVKSPDVIVMVSANVTALAAVVGLWRDDSRAFLMQSPEWRPRPPEVSNGRRLPALLASTVCYGVAAGLQIHWHPRLDWSACFNNKPNHSSLFRLGVNDGKFLRMRRPSVAQPVDRFPSATKCNSHHGSPCISHRCYARLAEYSTGCNIRCQRHQGRAHRSPRDFPHIPTHHSPQFQLFTLCARRLMGFRRVRSDSGKEKAWSASPGRNCQGLRSLHSRTWENEHRISS